MKHRLLSVSFLFFAIGLFAQQKNRPIIWFGPSDNVKVHGLNIAPILFKMPKNVKVNGINVEGVGIPLFLFMIPEDPADRYDTVKISNEFCVNGLSVSPAGLMHAGTVNGIAITPLYLFVEQVNGFDMALFFAISYKQNGLAVSVNNSTIELNGVQIGFFNKARRAKGVQIGVINRTVKLKGLQIGLWNVNEKRKLPIINW